MSGNQGSTRPYVSVKTQGCLDELLQILKKDMHVFESFEQIAGIMLDGGLSRGYADELSEIDVVIFVHEQAYESYANKQTPCALGITKIDGQLYDIKLLNYEDELKREYEQVALWDLSYAKIMYDPAGELQYLITQKLGKKTDPESAGGLMFNAWWCFRLAGDIWIRREDPMQGHYCLNNAIAPLISSIFAANREYIPHEKWLIHMSRTLEWKPENYEELLNKVISTGDMSLESLKVRQSAIENMWNQIDSRLCQMLSFHNGLSLMQKGAYESLKRIIERESIPVDEWKTFSSISDLNSEPLFSVCKLQDGYVTVDHDKLVSMSERDMYSWFLDIIKKLK